jgi:nitrate reductase assembly molybdenum cofactor insertion protein NarJ
MSTEQATFEGTAVKLLRESAEWRLLGLLFERPRPGWLEQVTALAGETADPHLRAAAEAARAEGTEGVYHTVFGPGGPAPPREVSYAQTLQPGGMLADLGAWYGAFAYRPEAGEAPDHVAVEAGFVAYLRLKEAYARARGEDEQAEVTADAAQSFVEEHLSLLAEPLSAVLAAGTIEYLDHAGAALLERVGPARKATGPGTDAGAAACPFVQIDGDPDSAGFECGAG